MNDWLTLPAAAAVAGVSAARLRRAFDAGLVPGYRRGRGRRFVRRGDAEPLSPAPPIEPVPATLEAGLDALARELAHTDTLDETLFELAGGLLDLTGGVDCDVWLPEGDRLRCVISRDLQGIDATVTGKVLDLERYPYTSRVLHAGRPRVVDDVGAASALTTFERDTMLYWGFRSVLSIPMQNGREVVGLIEVTDVVPRDFAAIRKALAGAGPRFAEAFNKAVLLDRLAQGNRRLESHNRRLACSSRPPVRSPRASCPRRCWRRSPGPPPRRWGRTSA